MTKRPVLTARLLDKIPVLRVVMNSSESRMAYGKKGTCR